MVRMEIHLIWFCGFSVRWEELKLHADRIEFFTIEQFSLSTPSEQFSFYFILMDGCVLAIRFSYSLILKPLITYEFTNILNWCKNNISFNVAFLSHFTLHELFPYVYSHSAASFIADSYRSRRRYSYSTELVFLFFKLFSSVCVVWCFSANVFNQFYSSSVTHLCWGDIERTSLRFCFFFCQLNVKQKPKLKICNLIVVEKLNIRGRMRWTESHYSSEARRLKSMHIIIVGILSARRRG